MPQKATFLNPDPPTHWSGPENKAHVRINEESSWAHLDSGSTINAVTPEFVQHPKNEPWGSFFGCLSFEWPGQLHAGYKWFWNIIFLTLGLCYHKGSGGRSARLPWRPSGPSHTRSNWLWIPSASYSEYTFNRIINVIKESEIDELPASLNGSRISNLLVCHWVELSIRSKAAAATQTMDLTDLN